MKQIIIFLLLVILGIIGYNLYSKYQRFSFAEYEYKIPENLDFASADNSVVLDYHQAVEVVNGYVITQWSANKIDVRNPKKDSETVKAAVSEYRKKLAAVAYYETQITHPKKEKITPKANKEEKKKELIKQLFLDNPKLLRIGERSAMVYEVQQLLIQKGHPIKHDGLFRNETFNALKSFEEKQGLFADGKLDAITLAALLE